MKIFNIRLSILILISTAFSAITQSYAATASDSEKLISIVNQVLEEHPLIMMQQQKLKQAEATLEANSQPLYNPELSADFESNVEDIKTIGLSQTIDWSDKRGAQSLIGTQKKQIAVSEYSLTRHKVLAEILSNISNYQTTLKATQLNNELISMLNKFIKIARRRHQVGDISQIELDLALLVAGKIKMQSANIKSKHYRAKSSLQMLLNTERLSIPEISIDRLKVDDVAIDKLLELHPKIVQLRLETQVSRARISLAKRMGAADPTFSLNAGKEGNEKIYSLGFSMPLMVRNSYKAEVDSARANSLSIEENYKNSYRILSVEAKSSREALLFNLEAYQDWIKLSQSGLNHRSIILQNLWDAGDLSTTDYLIQMQETIEAQIAAVQLKSDLIESWINYLLSSGQIENWQQSLGI